MKVLVRCTYEIEVEIPDDISPHFEIEDNSCPATRFVGHELHKAMDQSEEDGLCWCCKLKGENKILAINGKPVQ